VTQAVHTPTFTIGRGIGTPTTSQCGYTRVGRICYYSFDLRWNVDCTHDRAYINVSLPFDAEGGSNLSLSHNIHVMWNCVVSGYITDKSSTAGTASDPHPVRQGVPLVGNITGTQGSVRLHINGWNGSTIQRLQGTITYRIDDTVT